MVAFEAALGRGPTPVEAQLGWLRAPCGSDHSDGTSPPSPAGCKGRDPDSNGNPDSAHSPRQHGCPTQPMLVLSASLCHTLPARTGATARVPGGDCCGARTGAQPEKGSAIYRPVLRGPRVKAETVMGLLHLWLKHGTEIPTPRQSQEGKTTA